MLPPPAAMSGLGPSWGRSLKGGGGGAGCVRGRGVEIGQKVTDREKGGRSGPPHGVTKLLLLLRGTACVTQQ